MAFGAGRRTVVAQGGWAGSWELWARHNVSQTPSLSNKLGVSAAYALCGAGAWQKERRTGVGSPLNSVCVTDCSEISSRRRTEAVRQSPDSSNQSNRLAGSRRHRRRHHSATAATGASRHRRRRSCTSAPRRWARWRRRPSRCIDRWRARQCGPPPRCCTARGSARHPTQRRGRRCPTCPGSATKVR